MANLGAPIHLVRWIAAFLRTRTAQVVINGTLSIRVQMQMGFPQGSVLSPLLFLIFINDISQNVPNDSEIILFVDDSSLTATSNKLELANEKLQQAFSALEQWSVKNKLDLNIGKSCTFFFSSAPMEAKWRPNILLHNKRMKFSEGEDERCPRLLGLILDRTLCFQDHLRFVIDKVNDRRKILLCLASKSWGWKRSNLI